MKHERKKIGKIVEELTMFFFTVGATDIQTGIKMENRHVTVSFKANYHPEYREDLTKLEEYLNEPKNEGIEDFYWELAGTGDPGESSQLILIGMMIDEAEITISEKEVCLLLHKELEDTYE